MKVLFLAFTENDGSLSRAALEALGAAAAVGPVTAGLIGGAVSADSLGVEKVLTVTGPELAQARYSTDAAAAEAICRDAGADLVIAPQNSRTARALPGVAQRLGGVVDTHVTSLSPSIEATRWFYRQRMEGVLTRSARPWFVLLEPGCAAAWTGSGVSPIEAVPCEVTPALQRTNVTGTQAPKTEQQTIRPDAPILFVAGAGWTKKQKDGQPHVAEAGQLILDFIDAAQASLGSSKSLVDLSGEGQAVLPFLSHLNQVGQTGSTPRHAKGLATCCHGEEPHVVGWRFVGERRAVNLDANCGWARGKADVVYVADAFEVVKRVNQLLRAGGSSAASAS